MLLVVAGVPGSGKTTLAVRLSRLLGLEYLSLAELVLEVGSWEDYDWEHRSFIVDPSSLARALRERVRRSPHLVIEATEVLSLWEAGLEPLLVVVTRCNPRVLYERLAWRRWPRVKLVENIEAELVGVVSHQARTLYGVRRVCEIDTTRRSPERVTRTVLDALLEGRPCESIDWLSEGSDIVEFVARLSL